MIFEPGQMIEGFIVRRVHPSEELHGSLIEMEHAGTGARLVWLDNQAENMVFSIGFKTTPEDDTGVFHILEHSVLCGSEKYPLREPFVELMKGSVNTFLNAMTYPDMTLYPVSSRNTKDLMNLADVYLDAVFHPLVRKDERIFRQEGWRLECDEQGQAGFNGVVYNEMKGDIFVKDAVQELAVIRRLFAGTPYSYLSGGHPDAIPNLSYRIFQLLYDRFYHPSNAWIYLDGALPIMEMLQLLNSYLSPYERREPLPPIPLQKDVAGTDTVFYDLPEGQDPTGRSSLLLSRLTGTWQEKAKNCCLELICDVLAGNNESPLTRAVLGKQLAQDFSMTVDDTMQQSYLILEAENVTEGKEGEIYTLLRDFSKQVRRDGLDRQALEAALNRMIYHWREREEPQGITRAISVMSTWLYGGAPELGLEKRGLQDEIRAMIADGRIDRLAADILDPEGACVLHVLPQCGLKEAHRLEEKKRAERKLNAWTEERRSKNAAMNQAMLLRQQTPDTEENLQKLPHLTRKDLKTRPFWPETEELEQNGVKILQHSLACDGLVHLRMYFSLTDMPQDMLMQTQFLAILLGQVATEQSSAFDIQQRLTRYTGRFQITMEAQSHPTDGCRCRLSLVVHCSMLEENLPEVQKLLLEILEHTRLDEKERILEFAMQAKLDVEDKIDSAAHLLAYHRANRFGSAAGTMMDRMDGEENLRYFRHFAEAPEEEYTRFCKAAEQILGQIFNRSHLLVSVTADHPVNLEPLLSALPVGEAPEEWLTLPRENKRDTGFELSAAVGCAACAYHFSMAERALPGMLLPAISILNLEYLWNYVRVQGGAYGVHLAVFVDGTMSCYSYRDPTPAKTAVTLAGMADFLRDFAKNEPELDRYIISALNDMNPLMSARSIGALADHRYFGQVEREAADKLYSEALETRPADLLACADWMEEFNRGAALCLVGNTQMLEGCPELERISLNG